jgi:hypothetical protein
VSKKVEEEVAVVEEHPLAFPMWVEEGDPKEYLMVGGLAGAEVEGRIEANPRASSNRVLVVVVETELLVSD